LRLGVKEPRNDFLLTPSGPKGVWGYAPDPILRIATKQLSEVNFLKALFRRGQPQLELPPIE